MSRARPQSVAVLGTLNFVFALLGSLGLMFSIMGVNNAYQMPRTMASVPLPPGSPAVKFVFNSLHNPLFTVWVGTGLSLQALGVLCKFVTGLGLLSMKPWARKATIAYAIYVLLVAGAGVVGSWILMSLSMRPMWTRPLGSPIVTDPAAWQLAMTWSVAGPFGGCASLIYPLVLLYFMTRMDVRMAFSTKPALVESAP